jgi:predicted enzyme related to lactoylglutathione lyase
MKLSGVRIWVDDMAKARTFYGDLLGLPVKWDFGDAMGYDVGADLIVEMADDEARREGLLARFAGLSISVPDIDAAYRDLTAKGVEFLGPPEKMPWGGLLAHFKDPAGNVLTLLA